MISPTDNDERRAVIMHCQLLYSETAKLYRDLAPQMGKNAFGYKILYGPPRMGAPILFVGDQPGGGASDSEAGEEAGEHDRWPEHCEYGFERWRLAKQMRAIWSANVIDLGTSPARTGSIRPAAGG